MSPCLIHGLRIKGVNLATRLNKKILCFVDECGTPGDREFYLGAVILFAREVGRFDKSFSDLLDSNVNEIHAHKLSKPYLHGLLDRFRKKTEHGQIVLINRKGLIHGKSQMIIYAKSVIETVKVGLKRFREEILRRPTIDNVEVIIDANHLNTHIDFDIMISNAQLENGRSKAFHRVVKIDSAASRLLQLADVVAYSRKWLVNNDMNAAALRDRFGIQVM